MGSPSLGSLAAVREWCSLTDFPLSCSWGKGHTDSGQDKNRKGSGAGVAVCENPSAFLLALKEKLNKADSCLLPFTRDMEFSVAFVSITFLVQWTAFGSESEYALLFGGLPTPSFCAACCLHNFCQYLLFHYRLPPLWWMCDQYLATWIFLYFQWHLTKKKGGGATGRSPFALMSYFQPIDHYLWVGEITVLWLRKDFPIPLTLEAWTFGDCEASCAIVKCHDYGWGPSLSCLTLLIPSLSSCLLPEHFVLGGL